MFELTKVNFDNRSSRYELSKVLGLIGKILVLLIFDIINSQYFNITIFEHIRLHNKLLKQKDQDFQHKEQNGIFPRASYKLIYTSICNLKA